MMSWLKKRPQTITEKLTLHAKAAALEFMRKQIWCPLAVAIVIENRIFQEALDFDW